MVITRKNKKSVTKKKKKSKVNLDKKLLEKKLKKAITIN